MSRKSTSASSETTVSRSLQVSDLKRLPWRSIGPAIMGGRIADMVFKPGDPKTFLLGYATGGIWRTTNMGTTFAPLFDKEETSSIGALAYANAGPKWSGWKSTDTPEIRKKQGPGRIIWVGTGEGNGRNSSSWGNGVYRSTDAGATWQHLGLEDSHDIPRIAVNPDEPDTCYVAALGHLWGHNDTRGVYKTTDGGATWSRILELGNDCGACDVRLDPSNPNIVYAAMYMRLRTPFSMQSGGEKGGIYKSTDAGMTWTKLTGGLPSQTGRIGLDIYAKDPKKLIAVVESTESGGNSIRDDRMRGGGVFRSDNGGETWTRASVRSPRAFYFSKIYFDPNNDQRIYMLGWTTEVSDDGGKTFRGGVADILHADHHAMLINPNDSSHLIIGTDGGVYQSFDKGENWDFINTMATGQFYNISMDNSTPYRIIGGLQDNGTWMGPSATHKWEPKDDALRIPDTSITNADWQVVFWGDGFHAEFDREDPDVIYAEWQGGHITRVNTRTGEKRYLSPEPREGEPRHRYNWNSPFFVSPHDPTVIYHGGQYVFRLNFKGDNWERISPDLTTRHPEKMDTVGSNAEAFCTLVSLAESPLTKGELWAGSDDGLIHVSKDAGKNWANVTPPEVDGRYIARLQPSRFVAGRCYACVDGHRTHYYDPCVLVTEDFGQTWTNITSDLPERRSAKVIREDLTNPTTLYCGTERGLYLSLDRGKTWISLHGKGLPTVPIDDIQQHARETDLVLGTHGRSIWILDRAQWLGELNQAVLDSPLHLFTLPSAQPRWFLDYPGVWTHKVFRAPNPAYGLKIDYWVKEYLGEDVKIVIEDANGVVMKSLSGSGAPGYNRAVWNLQPETWLQLNDQNEELTMFNKFHVRAGKYQVKLTLGDHTASAWFEVLPPLQ